MPLYSRRRGAAPDGQSPEIRGPERVTSAAPAPSAVPRRRPRPVALAALVAVVIGTAGLTAGCGSGSGDGPRGSGAGDRLSEQHARGAHPSRKPHRPVHPWNRRPGSVAAVGDSITRGFDACSVLSDCPRVSWATGSASDVHSLAHRLLGHGAKRHSWNYAASGSVVADLPAQMSRAARRDPGLVTVMAGANDACRRTTSRMTSVPEFRAMFRKALRTLHKGAPKAEVYVASVPDLRRLWARGHGDPMAKRVWGLGICQSMLHDPSAATRAAQDRRQQVRQRVVAYNAVLRKECARFARCRYDGGAVFHYPFTKGELSRWDWFHPSRAGQRKLAALAYRGVTSARAPRGPGG